MKTRKNQTPRATCQSFRLHLLLWIVTLATTTCYSQQAINNGNFEYFQSQPPHYQQINSAWNQNTFTLGWTTASAASPDLFTDVSSFGVNYACGNPNVNADNPGIAPSWNPYSCYPQVCPLENLFGEQTPHSGDSYLGMRCHNGYEYIQTTFNTSYYPNGLAPGQCYRLQFWTSRSDLSTEAIRIQAAVSQGSIQDLNTTGLIDPLVDPDATVLTSSTFIVSKVVWTLVTLEFKAVGGETHLTIGMFNPNGITDPQNPSGPELPTILNESTATGTCGISSSNNPCSNCAQLIDAYYYIDDVSLEPVAGGGFTPSSNCTFTNANPNISGSFSNKNILISGDVVISGNATFDLCTVKCNAGSSITVPSGITFTIQNSTMSAGCANMWDGIIVNGRIVVEGSHIQDALVGINTQTTGASWALQRTSAGAPNYFERNNVDMIINQYSNSTNNVIKATTFDHSVVLNDYSLGNGLAGIKLIGPGSNSPETIGGSSANDGCTFIGAQCGIIATYYNINVNNCTFTGQWGQSINFQGLSASSAIRKLTVLNSTFNGTSTTNAKNHIYSVHQTDLTVQKCSFSNATEHAIIWSDNRNGELIIGDLANSALGNQFQNNNWSSVYAWGNQTTQTNLQTLSSNTNHAYTEITIGYNTFNCPTYSAGIILGEWALGSSVSYRSLEIYHNNINTVHQGIQIFNIRGWGGTNYSNQPSRISSNYIAVSTLNYANSFGIKVANASGLNIGQNGVNSQNWGNYVNKGIYLENVDHSVINENIILAGTGILASNWMYQSDLWCNTLVSYSAGINLANSVLRPNSNDPHGEIGTRQYNNVVPYTIIPWNADIYLWNSDVQYNKWMWNNATTNLAIGYSGNCGSGSVISSYTANDQCDQYGAGTPIYSQATERIDMTISGNPVAQWRADYTYETYRRMNGTGDSTVATNNIKSIITAENLINLGFYGDALILLASITPANNIEEHYVSVLSIFATINDQERELTSTEYDELVVIAELQTFNDGPGVALSRAYLRGMFNLTFEDSRSLEDHEINGTATVSVPCGIEPTSDTWLSFIDEDGNDLAIEGTYVSNDGSFIFDPIETDYYMNLYNETPFRIFSKYGSKYTVTNYDYHTLSEWLTASPISINLAGVSIETDSIDVAPFGNITNYTSMQDGLSNTFTVGSVSGANGSDLLIEKRDSKNNLLWTRSWDGPVSGNDTATCMFLDYDANVYVAGKVYNGQNYDVIVLKYDTNGNLVWCSTFACSFKVDNDPTGIIWNDADGTVEIVGTCGQNYRHIKLWQCLPSTGRFGETTSEELDNSVSSPFIYPSPTNGMITIDLKGQSGGVLELYSLEGKAVYSQQINQSQKVEIPATVVNGVYLLKFTGEGESYYQKLILQRQQD